MNKDSKISIGAVNTLDCPCKICKDKYPKCHGNCIKYLQFREELNKKNENIKKEKLRRIGYEI